MTQQPNNVSAAGVLSDAKQAFEAYLNEQKQIIGMPGLHARPSFIAGYQAGLAAASAQATAPVGWFVQRSSFGPWIEVERYEDGAVRLHRMDGDQATGPAVADVWKLVPVKLTPSMAEAYRAYWSSTQNIYGAWAAMLAAAPSPAAREAGDGVSEVQPPAGLTEREQFIWNLGHSAAAGSLQDAERYRWLREHHFSTLTNEEIDQQIAADAALLREAGSR